MPDHWLSRRLTVLHELLDRSESTYNEVSANVPGAGPEARAAQRMFTEEAEALARSISDRGRVLACIVSHDGFVVAAFGDQQEADTLAAAAHAGLEWASHGAPVGVVHQVVVVGDRHKFVILDLGTLAVSILAPSDENLGELLRS